MSEVVNYVQLVNDIPKRLQFSSLHFEDRDAVDPVSGMPKIIRVIVGMVTSEDGVPVSKTYSSTSSKLNSQLAKFISDFSLPGKIFVITKTGTGYLTQYQLQVL